MANIFPGVGLSLARIYLGRPNHIVIGGVRDVAAAKAGELGRLSVAASSRLVLVKIEAESYTDPAKAVQDLEAQGITRLDIAIANAAVAGKEVVAVSESDPADFANILAINTVGPVVLFKATKPLLDRSENPRWIAISSTAGSSTDQPMTFKFMGSRPMGVGYGASKAALNHVVRHIHSENPGLTTIALHPGFLNTDMGNRGAKVLGLEKPFHEVEDNTPLMVNLVSLTPQLQKPQALTCRRLTPLHERRTQAAS